MLRQRVVKYVVTVFLVGLAAISAAAQDGSRTQMLCRNSVASTIDQGAGVTVQTVTLAGDWGRNEATVFLPDRELAQGGIVFSHSKISWNDAETDLIPAALALARAGAAVIVPSHHDLGIRRIVRPIVTVRSLVCAQRWLG
jgi:hypothetical protein